jgi:hypothetical protein
VTRRKVDCVGSGLEISKCWGSPLSAHGPCPTRFLRGTGGWGEKVQKTRCVPAVQLAPPDLPHLRMHAVQVSKSRTLPGCIIPVIVREAVLAHIANLQAWLYREIFYARLLWKVDKLNSHRGAFW